MDEAAERSRRWISPTGRRFFSSVVGFGCPVFEREMRPLAVVVVDVDAEHAFEVTAVEDQ